MSKALILIAACFCVTACGLAETGAAEAAAAESKAQELKQAKETEARIQQQVGAANQQAAEQRQRAEADGQ
jgi:hypothetical protein